MDVFNNEYKRRRPKVPTCIIISDAVEPIIRTAVQDYYHNVEFNDIICEAVTISYLMGMGYPYEVAQKLFDTWGCIANLPEYYEPDKQ